MGLAGSVTFLVLGAEAAPSAESLLWAAAAGASGVIGVGCFYYALSRGTMGLIAPLTAVIGAGVPVALDIAGGDQLSTERLVGIAMALGAVVLISLPGGAHTADERRRLRLDLAEVPLVVVSGLGFAGFFIFIDQASAGGAVWWPLAAVRVVGLLLVATALAVLVARNARRGLRQRAWHVLGLDRLAHRTDRALPFATMLVVAGVGDLGGNLFFVLASQADAFAVAVILSSLYPVVTTLLAAAFLHERLRVLQLLGVALATLSVVLLR